MSRERYKIQFNKIHELILYSLKFNPEGFNSKMANKKKGPSVETERPLTIACHMKKVTKNIFFVKAEGFSLNISDPVSDN